MGAVTTVGAFLDALRTALVARNGLSGVAVYTAGVDDLSVGKEAIVFCVEDVEAAYEMPTVPRVETWEEYDVEGRTWVIKPGAGETVIKAARDRALAILEEVHDELATNDTMTATVTDCRVTGWTLQQLAGDGYRDARVAFTIHVQARFTPA